MKNIIFPALFVVLWSSGFIGAKLSAPYADPQLFLTYRFFITTVLLLGGFIILSKKITFPSAKEIFHSAISGILIHSVYLGGIFYVVSKGMSIGIVSLIVSMQPILVALLSIFFFREILNTYKKIGITLGFCGVALTIIFSQEMEGTLSSLLFIISFLSLCGISFGSIYQKKFCQNSDLLSSAIIQYTAAGFISYTVARIIGDDQIIWNASSIFALFWLVFALSIGAVLILLYLIKNNNNTKVSSLFYLIPALTAIQGYLFFDENINSVSLLGFALSLIGLYLVLKE